MRVWLQAGVDGFQVRDVENLKVSFLYMGGASSLGESSTTRQGRVVAASAFCLLGRAFIVGRVAEPHQELR